MTFSLVNANILTPEGVQEDTSLTVEDGTISAIGTGSTASVEINVEGGLIVPGLVDVHCDALEKIIEARPGVAMPQEHIMPQADSLYAAAGITTIYHAVSFAHHEGGVRNPTAALDIAADIANWRPFGAIDHRLHARFEVSAHEALPVVTQVISNGHADLVSVMDHSPGQGQFQTFESFFGYYGKTYNLTEDQVRELGEEKKQAAATGWLQAMELIKHARQAGVAVASHDDDSEERVRIIKDHGGTIAEFPINLETAAAAHDVGLATVMGAPNIVRGGSQSGNMKAIDAVHAGVLDCLCADYVPWSMMAAAMKLPTLSSLSLNQALDMVSKNPAQAVGLDDRGVIAVGKRADLVQVNLVRDLPQIVATWSRGRLAYQSHPPQLKGWPSALQATV